MLTGHASHQIGLDADIWFTPMPDRILPAKNAKTFRPRLMVKNRSEIDPRAWTENHAHN